MEALTLILVLLGCGLFLEGCANQHESNDELSINWEPIPEDDIEKNLESEDDDRPINNFVVLRCTSGGKTTVFLENASGIPIQRGAAVTGADIDLKKAGFIKCYIASDKKCIPNIEYNKWQCTNKSHTSNGCEEVTCTSFLFCLNGFGIIYVQEDGQEEGKMKVFGAFYIMELWLKEGYSTVSEERLALALEDARNYGEQKQLSNFTSTSFSNDTKYQGKSMRSLIYSAQKITRINCWKESSANLMGMTRVGI